MSCKEMSQVRHVGFLTLNNFSMIAFSNAIEILRMANYLLGQEVYQWSVITPDGLPVEASNGLSFSKTTSLDNISNRSHESPNSAGCISPGTRSKLTITVAGADHSSGMIGLGI